MANQNNITQKIPYLKLVLGSQVIVISLTKIDMILPILSLQKIPTKDDSIEGALNYHGTPIIVYHLSKLIQAPDIEYNLGSLLLLASVAQGLAGFLISDNLDLIEIAEDKIILPTLYRDVPFVTGVVETEHWSGWVLDLNHLIAFHLQSMGKNHG